MKKRVFVLFMCFCFFGCAGRTWQKNDGKTCLVLSVGAHHGIAQIGAIRAIEEKGIKIDCVVGNSMGALVGGIYASDPSSDLAPRMERILLNYIQRTKDKASEDAFFAGLIGFFVAGPAGAAAGATLGAGSVNKVDHKRFTAAIREELGSRNIEELPLSFLTSHIELRKSGIQMVDETSGDLVAAISASIANSLIFNDLSVKPGASVDPGVDRLARVPLDLTCRKFPHSRIIAVNVTGEEGIQTKSMECPILEIMIPPSEIEIRDILKSKKSRDELVDHGYQITKNFLASTL